MEPEGESAMTPAQYPIPPIPEFEADSPARPAVGSPARDESLLAQILPSGSVAQAFSSPKSPVLRSTPADSPPSELAAMDQYLPWNASLQVGESMDSPLLPAPLTPRIIRAVVAMPIPYIIYIIYQACTISGHVCPPYIESQARCGTLHAIPLRLCSSHT